MSASLPNTFLRSRIAWLLFGAGLLLFASCAVEQKSFDTASGGDHKRDLAKKIPLNRTVTDRVNAPAGDNTDWKYIDVEEDGDLKIIISVDNPNVDGSLMVYDELGQPIHRANISPKEPMYEFDSAVEKGKKYYVKVALTKFETSYSVGNQFKKKEEAGVIAITTTEERPVVRVPRGPKPPPPPPKEEEPAAEDPTKVVVTTVILNVIPWKEGKASRITFQQGSDAGVKRGGVVAISSGGSCVVKEVFPGTSVCFVEKPPTDFKEGTRVVITSEK